MMPTTGGVTEAVYGSLMRIQRGWSYRYQYRVIVGVEMPHSNLLVMERPHYRYMYLKDGQGETISRYPLCLCYV